MQLSRRVRALKPSATLAVANKAKALAAQGVEVLSFAAGEPDFDTPPPIVAAAIESLRAGHTKYMPTAGDPATRRAIAEKLSQENAIPGVTPEHVVITTGGKHAIYLVFQALLDPPLPGEEPWDVLLPVPAWVSYDPIARLSGGRVVELPTSAKTDFKITPEQLEQAITPRSRLLVINSPSNPCGTMYTPEELTLIAAVVERAAASKAPDLVVVSDEIYEKITFGGIPHFSIGASPAIADRVVTINGMSKAYSMTGWRVGYLAGSGEAGLQVAKACEKLQGQTTTNVTSFVYSAATVAITACGGEVEQMRRAFAQRASMIYDLARSITGLSCVKPTGAFYLFIDVSALFGRTSAAGRRIGSAMDFAEALLDEHRVAVVPGEDFGGCGANHVRMSFACSEEQIAEGMNRIAIFVRALT
ncbi:MAG: pyridoxal phosphate-dependent aminotransferase [Phycisphaeraceae bacterium]|nr:pyridoxal phosphate-dependent aminotransferase [Phycisphaeraceae bacterium]